MTIGTAVYLLPDVDVYTCTYLYIQMRDRPIPNESCLDCSYLDMCMYMYVHPMYEFTELCAPSSLFSSLYAYLFADSKGCEEHKSECCVCQDVAVNPVKLPCSHVFCYLCVKGVAVRGGTCALCRQPIPRGFLDQPNVLSVDCFNKSPEHYHWFYEGRRGGWWMYEDRTSTDIEKAYIEKVKLLKIQISGFHYVIDFDKMVQVRENHPSRTRKIKRDVVSSGGVKGIAGIHMGGTDLVPGIDLKSNDSESRTH